MKKCRIVCLVFFLLFLGIGYFFFGGDTDALILELIEQGETMDVLVTYDKNNEQECDGLGVTHVPFGQVISTCGKFWFVTFWGRWRNLRQDIQGFGTKSSADFDQHSRFQFSFS